MTLEQLTKKVYQKLKDKNFGSETGRLFAIQVNLTGKIGGVFYIEVLDGRLSVMPYEYIDRDASLFMTMTNFTNLLSGKLEIQEAYSADKIRIEGDMDKVEIFAQLLMQ